MAMSATAIRFDECEKDWIQSYASVLGNGGGVSFSVEWSKAATKQLLNIPKKQRLIILSWVQEHLNGCEDPRRAPNGKQLQGTDSGWRWRVGVYRILARIEDGKAVIEVVRVGHRQGVYKNMPRL